MTRAYAHAFIAHHGPLMTEAIDTLIGKRPETAEEPPAFVRPMGCYESEAKRAEAEGTPSSRENGGGETDNSPSTAPPPLTPLCLSLLPKDWNDVANLVQRHPEAVAERHFMYMQRGSGFPEVFMRALHIERAPFVVVVPNEPLACEVRCDLCREHRLEELCPGCHGTKRRVKTIADVQHFVDAGDRYPMGGSAWQMAPYRSEW